MAVEKARIFFIRVNSSSSFMMRSLERDSRVDGHYNVEELQGLRVEAMSMFSLLAVQSNSAQSCLKRIEKTSFLLSPFLKASFQKKRPFQVKTEA